MKMKALNVIRQHGAKAALSIGSTLAAASSFAAGEITDAAGAATKISAVGGDVSTIGWAVLGVLVVAAGFKYMRRSI